MRVELSGKRALVTGASSGIGFEVAKGLLSLGARVLITGRDQKKLHLAADFLRKDTGCDTIDPIVADFASTQDINALIKSAGALDILVNNAGLYADSREMTPEGHDLVWQANYLAPAHLTLQLGQAMQPGSRIVNVASRAHQQGKLTLEDPSFQDRSYSGVGAYAQSKLALIMLTRHLAKLWGNDAPHINAVHPGVVRTDLARNAGLMGFAFSMLKPFFLSPRMGARGVLHVACSPFSAEETGKYFNQLTPQKPSSQALDNDACEKLYDYTVSALAAFV